MELTLLQNDARADKCRHWQIGGLGLVVFGLAAFTAVLIGFPPVGKANADRLELSTDRYPPAVRFAGGIYPHNQTHEVALGYSLLMKATGTSCLQFSHWPVYEVTFPLNEQPPVQYKLSFNLGWGRWELTKSSVCDGVQTVLVSESVATPIEQSLDPTIMKEWRLAAHGDLLLLGGLQCEMTSGTDHTAVESAPHAEVLELRPRMSGQHFLQQAVLRIRPHQRRNAAAGQSSEMGAYPAVVHFSGGAFSPSVPREPLFTYDLDLNATVKCPTLQPNPYPVYEASFTLNHQPPARYQLTYNMRWMVWQVSKLYCDSVETVLVSNHIVTEPFPRPQVPTMVRGWSALPGQSDAGFVSLIGGLKLEPGMSPHVPLPLPSAVKFLRFEPHAVDPEYLRDCPIELFEGLSEDNDMPVFKRVFGVYPPKYSWTDKSHRTFLISFNLDEQCWEVQSTLPGVFGTLARNMKSPVQDPMGSPSGLEGWNCTGPQSIYQARGVRLVNVPA